MIPEIGHFVLLLAFFVCVVQSIIPLVGAHRNDESLMRVASISAVTSFTLVSLSFASLAWSFLSSDFSVRLVAAHSEIAKPTIYKFTGVWANHEGSMLLWVLILVLFAAAIAIFGDKLPMTLKARVLAVQGMIATAFLAFLIFTSNPFARLDMVPANGNGMNPILQDPGLAIHPPFLYLGYVGFSVAFSFAVAALIEGKVDAAWARWVRPWVLAAWCFLTLGITLGSFWAYYILGWGGWWFWDPVENVSFMPWLAGTALLHSALVVERRHALVTWTILLAILTFSLSLLGTFVVRSGVLTSVHAFATDPARGVFILAILFGATGGALLLYAWRMSAVRQGAPFAMFSREGSLVLNNALLISACGTVFLGTFYPLFIDLMTTDKISVGPPFYNRTFVPLFIPVLLVMAVGPFLKWKRDNWRDVAGKMKVPLIAAGDCFGDCDGAQRRHLLINRRRIDSGGVDNCRRDLGSYQANQARDCPPQHNLESFAHNASVIFWIGARSCGHGLRRCSHCNGDDVATRKYFGHECRRYNNNWRLSGVVEKRRKYKGAELRCRARHVRIFGQWQNFCNPDAGAALLHRSTKANNADRDSDESYFKSLRGDGRTGCPG